MKLDCRNAFNSLYRSVLARAVKGTGLERYVAWAYLNSPPNLVIAPGFSIPSRRGVQQGDPLGSTLFTTLPASAPPC